MSNHRLSVKKGNKKRGVQLLSYTPRSCPLYGGLDARYSLSSSSIIRFISAILSLTQEADIFSFIDIDTMLSPLRQRSKTFSSSSLKGQFST